MWVGSFYSASLLCSYSEMERGPVDSRAGLVSAMVLETPSRAQLSRNRIVSSDVYYQLHVGENGIVITKCHT